MKKHPSGRPIRKPEKRDYSMMAHRYVGFRCPRLNEKRHDTYAMGFIDHRAGYLPDWEDSAKGGK